MLPAQAPAPFGLSTPLHEAPTTALTQLEAAPQELALEQLLVLQGPVLPELASQARAQSAELASQVRAQFAQQDPAQQVRAMLALVSAMLEVLAIGLPDLVP